VAALANSLSAEQKFQIARGCRRHRDPSITYNQFLPTLGVRLNGYRCYSSTVDPSLSNESPSSATGAPGMVHGEFEPAVPAGTYTDDQLNDVFPAEGITVERSATAP
jgi:hypothetical protein